MAECLRAFVREAVRAAFPIRRSDRRSEAARDEEERRAQAGALLIADGLVDLRRIGMVADALAKG